MNAARFGKLLCCVLSASALLSCRADGQPQSSGGAAASFLSPGGGATTARTVTVPSRFEPAAFGAVRGAVNPWLPLLPGLRWIREGTTEVGHRKIPHRVVSTVGSISKVVAGVATTVVLDQEVDGGQTTAQSLDFYAQDRAGNVWSVGSYTEKYDAGRLIAVTDAWLAGVRGGTAGVLMPADPPATAGRWDIAQPPGKDSDAAEVVRAHQRVCVAFSCYADVTVVREGKATALDNELKYYANGVGQVLNEPKSKSFHKDVEQLVNNLMLTSEGLADVNTTVTRLLADARIQRPALFGDSTSPGPEGNP